MYEWRLYEPGGHESEWNKPDTRKNAIWSHYVKSKNGEYIEAEWEVGKWLV